MLIRRRLLGLALLLTIAGCSAGNGRAASQAIEESKAPTELRDGTYSCEAMNETRSNGPYSLSCDKSGDELVIHFDNGGYISADIDSQITQDGSSWEIDATHSERGDSWHLTIDP